LQLPIRNVRCSVASKGKRTWTNPPLPHSGREWTHMRHQRADFADFFPTCGKFGVALAWPVRARVSARPGRAFSTPANTPVAGAGGSMIKSDLVRRVAGKNPHLHAKDAERIVNAVLEEIGIALAERGRVEMRGFGVFTVRLRSARPGAQSEERRGR
jgi:nucleoid DNA-binding protein